MAPKRARNQAGASSSSAGADPPNWKSKPLSSLPRESQARLYYKKMEEMQEITSVLLVERWTELKDFENFGVVECFRRLGWLEALTFKEIPKNESKIYLTQIVEWMSTLERENGNNPPWTTKLTGTVGGVPVEMSINTLRGLAQFDTLPDEEYEKVTDEFIYGEQRTDGWIEMLQELFLVNRRRIDEGFSMDLKELKPLPRLIMKIFIWNVCPRRSDKQKLRSMDVRTLYALVTSNPKFPFTQLIMANVWDSHENSKKTAIPHCHVINQLLLKAHVIGRGAKPEIISPKRFNRSSLAHGEFAFSSIPTHYILYDMATKQEKRFPKVTVGDESEEEEFDDLGRMGPDSSFPTRPAGYGDWTGFEQTLWDDNQHQWGELRRRAEREDERRAAWEEKVENELAQIRDEDIQTRQAVETQGFYQQQYNYNLYDWSEQQRHWHDFVNQREYLQHANRHDFENMMRTEGNGSGQPLPHFPEMIHPQWWPGEYRNHGGDGASSSHPPEVQDPFDTRELSRSLYDSIFGPNR